MKCSNRYKWIFWFLRAKHNLIISNAFYTLEDKNVIDVVRTCQDCTFKDVLTLDLETLLEIARLYPNAFKDTLRSYLQSWMI